MASKGPECGLCQAYMTWRCCFQANIEWSQAFSSRYTRKWAAKMPQVTQGLWFRKLWVQISLVVPPSDYFLSVLLALKDSEVKEILESLNPDKGFIPKKKFQKDMIVRIVEGPFSEFTGKIETVFEEKETLRVMISLFGRDTPVEIEFTQVEKAE